MKRPKARGLWTCEVIESNSERVRVWFVSACVEFRDICRTLVNLLIDFGGKSFDSELQKRAVNAHSRLRPCEVRRRDPYPEGSDISSTYFQAAVHCRATRTRDMLRADPEAKFALSCRIFRDIS